MRKGLTAGLGRAKEASSAGQETAKSLLSHRGYYWIGLAVSLKNKTGLNPPFGEAGVCYHTEQAIFLFW